MSTMHRAAVAAGLALLLGNPGEGAPASTPRAVVEPNTTTAADSVITFNEIMYHPGADSPDVEWLELFNATSIDIDLSAWRIEGAIDFQFPTNTILAAGAYVLVASDPVALETATGGIPVFGPFTNRLGNEGETLRLRNHNGRLMDELSYGDEPPWPIAADGSGASLAKLAAYAATSPAPNWRASTQTGGTPGKPNFPETDSDYPSTVELVNKASPGRWRVPNEADYAEAWTLAAYNDSLWTAGTASIGFDAGVPASGAPAVSRAYSFEGDATDISGQGCDGASFGVQFSGNACPAADSAQAAQFDGSSSQVHVQDPVNPSAYTLALWVSVDTVQPCSILVRTDSNGPRTSWSHQLRINAAGRFEHYLWDGSERTVAATNVIQPGAWYHVAATANDGGLMRIYVNGISSGGSATLGSLWGGGNQWRFGTDSGHTPNFFHGRLDEAGIWDVVLSEQDIARLASGYAPVLLNGYHSLIVTDVQTSLFGNSSSLLVRLPFNVTAGTTFDRLTLSVGYDDGFVAYLNGTEVARRNASDPLSHNSTSTGKAPARAVLAGEAFDLTAQRTNLVNGRNVLAFHALNCAASDTNFLLTASFTGVQAAPVPGRGEFLFTEISAAADESFFVELCNFATSNLPLAGFSIGTGAGLVFSFGSASLGPGQFLTLSTNDLGFNVAAGDRLFLYDPARNVLDAVKAGDRSQGRLADAPWSDWLFPSAPTPGATNLFSLHDEIVLNEILYHHAPVNTTNAGALVTTENDEEWIELYNRSGTAADLGGWRLADAVSFSFPSNTVLAPGAYLVVANNAAVLRARYPDVAVIGDFAGRLASRGERVRLLDAQGNPADEVRYLTGFPWPEYADGGGSSIELRDPRADNSVAESWADSLEYSQASWHRYTVRARAVNPVYSPNLYSFHELRLGLLDAGEALLDNITVVELPTNGPPRQLLQNTNFDNGTRFWRLTGNHVHSRVEFDPEAPANRVLHLLATGPMSYLENQLESSLKSGGALVPVVAGRDYEISFDAKWLAGSPQIHVELYYNRVAATVRLERPPDTGTPGRRNSTFLVNAGPTYRELEHLPVLPGPTNDISVSVSAADPDGVAGLVLNYSVNGGTWRSAPMSPAPSPPAPGGWVVHTGSIPAQALGSVIQFFVQGADTTGATSSFPAAGPDSRALVKVDVPQGRSDKQTLRTIMTPADSALLHTFVNLMSDDLLPCTIVHNEREVFYDCRIRLHGSMFSRPDAATTGLRLEFPSDHLFRGSLRSVVVRRGNLVETIGHHIVNQAGGLPSSYCDVVHLVSHHPQNVGPATLQLANLDRVFIDSQFGNNNDGTLFKLEGIRVYQTTDDGTPEGYKLPQPVDFVWDYDLKNLGDDQEQYRWSVLILNQRARDDYARAMAMCKTFGLAGSALQQAVPGVIDIDQWARYFALQNLVGVADIYGVDNPHNIAFYARPDDGRVEVLQNDWGFAFYLSTGASIYGRNKVYEILRLPVYRRLYQGHLLDLVNTTFNSTYLTRWAQHFSRVTGQGFGNVPGYADARGAAVRSQLAQKVVFAITSNGGQDFSVTTPTVTLAGFGWIDVHGIRLADHTNLLSVVWLDDLRWETVVPLEPGTNHLDLVACDYRGNTVGQASIRVATTSSGLPQRDALRITELMYHPPPPTPAEVAAGFTSAEDFEYIELMNTSATEVSLLGVRFTTGVTFDFTGSAVTNLGAGQRVLVVGRRPAFACRYGTNLPVAGPFTGHLNNSGELLTLVDCWGNVIQQFTYLPDGAWPATANGDGSSLEMPSPSASCADPLSWQASVVHGGTPGWPAVVRPAFTYISVEATQVRLRFRAAPEQPYTVQWCASLDAGIWHTLATVPAGSSARVEEVAAPFEAGALERIYRLCTP